MNDPVKLSLRATLRADMAAIGINSKNVLAAFVYLLTRPAFSTVCLVRLAARATSRGRAGRLMAKFFWRLNVLWHGCYIAPEAQIAAGLNLPHAVGIVVGRDAIIGLNATIYQNVTIGQRAGANGIERYPVIGDNVTLYAGAVVVGGIMIGDGAQIGANAVVIRDVPAGGIAVGVPARLVSTSIANVA